MNKTTFKKGTGKDGVGERVENQQRRTQSMLVKDRKAERREYDMAHFGERLDDQRDELQAVFDAFHSLSAHRMNEIVKVLTLISTIMLPLTFLAGVYGMNFDNMPELHMPYAYGGVWALMTAVALALVMFFRRRGLL